MASRTNRPWPGETTRSRAGRLSPKAPAAMRTGRTSCGPRMGVGPQLAAPDPPHRDRAAVYRQHEVADRKILDPAFTVRRGDVRAGGEALDRSRSPPSIP